MDSEKLIERLEAWNEQHLSVVCGNGHFACDYLCENEDCIVVRAAAAIATLQAENKKLRAELEQVKAERDAGISDLETIMAYGGGNLDTCQYCKNGQCYARGGTKLCLPQWRGQKKD